jgi:hypothetical protein
MKVQLNSEGAPASELELERLRRAIGSEPPSDYVDFLSSRNGCRVETNVFRVDETNDSGVNTFLDVGRVIDEKAALGGRLSRHAWPVADAEGGNYVCLRREESGTWCVVFWDHELEQETVLSSTFSAFLESLEKFDLASVELKPGQVISAWIDPSLLTEDDE